MEKTDPLYNSKKISWLQTIVTHTVLLYSFIIQLLLNIFDKENTDFIKYLTTVYKIYIVGVFLPGRFFLLCYNLAVFNIFCDFHVNGDANFLMSE